jgi:hypothetical protein
MLFSYFFIQLRANGIHKKTPITKYHLYRLKYFKISWVLTHIPGMKENNLPKYIPISERLDMAKSIQVIGITINKYILDRI